VSNLTSDLENIIAVVKGAVNFAKITGVKGNNNQYRAEYFI